MLIGVIGGLLLSWLALIVFVWIRRPRTGSALEGIRLLPDIIRLVRAIAADGDVAGGVRVRIWLLLVYLAVPLDLVPDFVPVIGYLDDVVVVFAVLRSVVRRAGPETVRRHWSGTQTGLEAVWRLARLPGHD